METLPDNITIQQFILVETLHDNSSSNVTVQQFVLVDCILCNVKLRISGRFGDEHR